MELHPQTQSWRARGDRTNGLGRAHERGAMLIVALMVLTLLAILGSAFVTLMRMESRATENFRNIRAAEMLANSAESNAIALLRSGMFWDGFTHFDRKRSPWLFGLKSPEGDLRYERRLEDTPPEEASLAGVLTDEDPPTRREQYKTKLIDTSAQIYINGDQSNLPSLLDNLALALEKDEDVGVNPFRLGGGETIRGEDIVRFRQKLGGRFATKTQLRTLLGDRNYRVIADYITAHSWVDESTTRGSDGQSEMTAILRPDLSTGIQRGSGLRTDITGVPGVTAEPRAPININTAPRPVLVAALTGLSGRRPFPFVEISVQPIDGPSRGLIDTTGTFPPENEETKLQTTPVWVYSKPLTLAQATQIANEIIRARKQAPFKVWRSASTRDNTVGFENFVDQLDDSLFPAPNAVRVRHPDPKVAPNRVSGFLRDSASPAGRMWSRGHDAVERSERQSRGLAYSTNNAFYYDMMRSILKANFNPNARINKFNPNSVAYMPVDKANLIRLDEGDNVTTYPGHTTEFCFEPNGIFEIVTVAEIFRIDGGREELISETKQRTLVKVWEILRHTTQFDFERPFQAGNRSSVSSRENIRTYPDPLDLLHRDHYYGSIVDGRVELAGYIDAELTDVANDSQRFDYYESQQNILLAHGFSARSARDKETLRRVIRDGQGGALPKELDKALNPEFTRDSQMRLRYDAHNWKLIENQVEDPESLKYATVNSAFAGTDVFPDGYHSGIFRTRPTGVRFMYFPASRYRNNPQDPGEIGRQRRNDLGSMAYYNGGVAFWVKFDFDPQDPVFAGLFGATQVQSRVNDTPTSSEGSQIFVYKNTDGQLRVTRLYYHQAFLETSNDDTGTSSQNPLPYVERDSTQSIEDQVDIDPRKRFARTDAIISLAGNQGVNWRAHEWHHVVIAWNDETSGKPIAIWLDGQESAVVPYSLGEGDFVTLNEEEPKDGMFVGAFYRDQLSATEGVFKFGTNLIYEDGLAVERARSIKRVVANATIDEFVSFQGVYNPRPHGYFTDKPGIYANSFEIPFPDGIERIRLRSFTWTQYVPALWSGIGVDWQDSNMSMSVINAGGSGREKTLRDPGADTASNLGVAGSWIYPTGGRNLEGRTGELVYEVRMLGARGQGPSGGKTVGSPVLDDVTLTYYLPSAEYILTESVE